MNEKKSILLINNNEVILSSKLNMIYFFKLYFIDSVFFSAKNYQYDLFENPK